MADGCCWSWVERVRITHSFSRIERDCPGPVQDMAIETLGLAAKVYEQGNTLTVRWVPGHKGSSATRWPTHMQRRQRGGESWIWRARRIWKSKSVLPQEQSGREG